VADGKRKAICSIGAGPHAELLAVSGETFSIFASAHGYDVVLRTELPAPERPASWSKVLFLRELIDEYDFVFWVDADAAIVDASRDVLDDCRRGTFLAVVAHHYDAQVVPNLGVIGLRSGRRARRFLDLLWADTRYVEHKWWENAAALELLGFEFEPVRRVRRSPWYRRTTFLPREWNSIAADPSPHPRINHYPGRSHEHRIERLTADLELLRSRSGMPR